MSAKVFIHGFQQTLPDHEKAKGEYVDGRGIRTFLYRKGAGYVLHTIDPNDPAVEQTATFIGSRDAALWLLAHGIEAPVELWPDLRGRVPFDANGRPIIPPINTPDEPETFERLTPNQRKLVAYLQDRDTESAIRDAMRHMGKSPASNTHRRSFMETLRRTSARLANYYPHLDIDLDRIAKTITLTRTPATK